MYSNEFEDIKNQSLFVGQLLQSINWILETKANADYFIDFIGLRNPAADYNATSKNRSMIIFASNTVLGILRRLTRKAILLPQILPFLNALVSLVINLNALWRPEYKIRCHQDYQKIVFEPTNDVERQQLLEAPTVTHSDVDDKSVVYRMQSYLWALHENTYAALGVSIALLSPDVLDSNVNFLDALRDIECLPNLKLKMILKTYIRPLIQKCMDNVIYYDRLLLPLVSNFFTFAFRKINSRWDKVKERSQSLEDEHINDQAVLDKELIEDQSNRMLSREFVDAWSTLLIQNIDRSKSTNDDEENEMKDVSIQLLENEGAAQMTQAGSYLLQFNTSVIVQCSIVSVTWLDSLASHKASLINLVLVNKLMNENLIKTRDEVCFYLKHILIALSYFGEHEQNQARLLQLVLALYEGVVNKIGFDDVKSGFYEVSGCSAESWSAFEVKLIKPNAAGKNQSSEKKKKEALKCLLSSVIGVS